MYSVPGSQGEFVESRWEILVICINEAIDGQRKYQIDAAWGGATYFLRVLPTSHLEEQHVTPAFRPQTERSIYAVDSKHSLLRVRKSACLLSLFAHRLFSNR
jgi:hypothetical protein